MNLSATVYPLPPGWPVDVSIDTQKDNWGGKPYVERVKRMSDLIKQDDPDVVVLQEVWNQDNKEGFVAELSKNGPYPFYVSKIAGAHPGAGNPLALPGEGSDLDKFTQMLNQGNLLAWASMAAGVPVYLVEIHYQDSGIMLFSKKPFTPFTNPDLKYDPSVEVVASNGPSSPYWGSLPGEVAAVVYSGASGMDELASKAVGMVRIQQTPSSIVNVAFTHTNSDESSLDGEPARAFQLDAIRGLMLTALTPTQLEHEQVFLAGDLNTTGSNETAKLSEEWLVEFGSKADHNPFAVNPGVFFACGEGPCTATSGGTLDPSGSFMTDSWGFDSSPQDLNHPVDYVLHNHVSIGSKQNCMQHIRVGSEMTDIDNGMDLSDHLPVHADFNIAAPQCTPNEDSPFGPKVVAFTQSAPVQISAGVITHPGNMQWFKVSEPGTYWIKVQGAVAFEVYEDDDLSHPIKAYHGEFNEMQGERRVSHKPLFVRVFGANPDGTPNRTITGGYTIRIQKAMGKWFDDSIAIEPAAPNPYTWLSSGTPQDQVFFDFYTNRTLNGEFADSNIVHRTLWYGDLQDSTTIENALYDTDTHPLGAELNAANPGGYADYLPLGATTKQGYVVNLPDLPRAPASGGLEKPKKYFYELRLGSAVPSLPQNLVTTLNFRTNLQYLNPVALYAYETVDWSSDDASVGFYLDGAKDDCGPPQMLTCHYVPAQEGQRLPIFPTPVKLGPFKKEAMPSVWADAVNLGHDYNGAQLYPIVLDPDEPGKTDCDKNAPEDSPKGCQVQHMSRPYDGTYDYRLYYSVSHDTDTR